MEYEIRSVQVNTDIIEPLTCRGFSRRLVMEVDIKPNTPPTTEDLETFRCRGLSSQFFTRVEIELYKQLTIDDLEALTAAMKEKLLASQQ
jgi:hypothetical protein